MYTLSICVKVLEGESERGSERARERKSEGKAMGCYHSCSITAAALLFVSLPGCGCGSSSLPYFCSTFLLFGAFVDNDRPAFAGTGMPRYPSMQGTGIFRSDLFIASLAYIQILNREALRKFSEFGLCLNSLLNIHSNFLHPLAFRFPETIPTKRLGTLPSKNCGQRTHQWLCWLYIIVKTWCPAWW